MTEAEQIIRDSRWERRSAIRLERHRAWLAECRKADKAIAAQQKPKPEPAPRQVREPEPREPYVFIHRCPEVSTEGEVCRICRWIRERNSAISQVKQAEIDCDEMKDGGK